VTHCASSSFLHTAPQERALGLLDLAAGVILVLWLQVVGLVAGQVLHQVLHALPVLLLVVLPKSRWVRLTCVMTGFAWIFMLAVITPMLNRALLQGGLWQRREIFVWLAPVAAALSALWAAVNLTLLARKPKRWPIFVVGFIVLIPVLASLHPHWQRWFVVPLRRLLEGQVIWAAVLAGELLAVVAAIWGGTMLVVRRHDLRPDRRVIGWQVLYWGFFLACMVLGLLPALNP
jgi:hypothetical protein